MLRLMCRVNAIPLKTIQVLITIGREGIQNIITAPLLLHKGLHSLECHVMRLLAQSSDELVERSLTTVELFFTNVSTLIQAYLQCMLAVVDVDVVAVILEHVNNDSCNSVDNGSF